MTLLVFFKMSFWKNVIVNVSPENDYPTIALTCEEKLDQMFMPLVLSPIYAFMCAVQTVSLSPPLPFKHPAEHCIINLSKFLPDSFFHNLFDFNFQVMADYGCLKTFQCFLLNLRWYIFSTKKKNYPPNLFKY